MTQPACVYQLSSTADPSVPAHLLIDRNVYLGALREFDAANRFRILISKRLLAEHMFAGGRGLFHDSDLLGWIHGYVDDLDFRLPQQLFDARVNPRDPVFFGGALRLFTIPVGNADNFEPCLLVGGQVSIVDDSSGTDNADSAVHA